MHQKFDGLGNGSESPAEAEIGLDTDLFTH